MCERERQREREKGTSRDRPPNKDVYMIVEVHACVDACVYAHLCHVCQKDRETNNERQQDILHRDSKEKQKI